MQTTSEGSLLDIIDLAHSLRQEQLFITNEKSTFKKLANNLSTCSENVSQLAWICSQQRQNLNNLIVSKPETGPSSCCRRANSLENTKFVQAYQAKGVKYQHVIAYTNLFNYLHRSPHLLAQCLAIGDRIYRATQDKLVIIVETIANGLYDNFIHTKDVEMVLKLLQKLIELQIVDCDNPRRMFRTGSCTFSRLYHRLHESLFSAKLFLTASLYDPIMKVLTEDEIQLDIDPSKTVANFSTKERLKRFGQPGTADYEIKLRKYHEEIIDLLFNLANRFVKSLAQNWPLFPSTLRWLVQSLCHLLKRNQFTDKDINAILTEMIFTNFICPAVVTPEYYGISDAPISENARFNLIQIGQILQMLALIKYEDVDLKMMDLYKKFDRNIVSDLLSQLLPNEHGISMLAISALPATTTERKAVLVTQFELNTLIEMLRNVLDNDGLSISGEDRRKLSEIVEHLPDKFETYINDIQEQNVIHAIKTTTTTKTQNFINMQKKTKSKLAKTISLNVPSIDSDTDIPVSSSTTPSGNILNGHNNYHSQNNHHHHGRHYGGGHNHHHHHGGGQHHPNNNNHSLNNNHIGNSNNGYEDYEQVLSIPISICEENKFHLLTEEEVLTMNSISNPGVEPILSEKNVEELGRRTEEDHETIDGVVLRNQKHARFSLSHDDASIGNTSDNLEAVSEAPSNHSVASSMELEEHYQNDNLSDMVSANVSGRGTPNISGRDTPSSQVTDGDNRPPQIPTPQMAKILSKARSDIEDKFCKFEIKKLMEGDETISIISDTWSTDVLASDSETIEATDRDRNFSTPLIPSSVILPGDNNFDPLSGVGSQLRAHNLDVSETQSESAWSTDVLASDSEKMTEIDTDDNQSIAAKSDITDAGRSDNGAGGGDRRLEERGIRAPDSPMFFSPRIPNINFRTPESPMYQVGRGGIGSGGEISFFGHRGGADEVGLSGGRFENPVISSLLRHSRDREDSSAEGAVGGVSLVAGGDAVDLSNPFINDRFNRRDVMGRREYERQSFLTPNGASNRQNSIESSNSEISSNFDRDEKRLFDYRKQTKEYVENTPIVRDYKPYDEQNNNQYANYEQLSATDVIKTNPNIINPFDVNENDAPPASSSAQSYSNSPIKKFEDEMSDELVEHRRISSEQRNATFDGRRNGMIEFAATSSTNSSSATAANLATTVISRTVITSTSRTSTMNNRVTNNYENHQILATTSSTSSSAPLLVPKDEPNDILVATSGINQPDDELILVKKTSSLTLTSKNTGAIPKSISFDSSADKISRNSSNSSNNSNNYMKRSESTRAHSGFFHKIKQGFKNRRPKFQSLHDIESSHDFTLAPSDPVVTEAGMQFNSEILSLNNNFVDPTEDILAKYRRKASSSSDAAASDSTGSHLSSKSNKSNSDTEQPQNQLLNAEDSHTLFNAAKRKLRIVLSSNDLQTTDFHHSCYSINSPLLIYLQIQLAQALNLQNLKQVSHVSEAMRCISSITSSHEHQQLLNELQQDLYKRQAYIQYLIRYRQNLLSTIENLDRFEYRLKNDRETYNRHLIMVCIRMFLEKREPALQKFMEKFSKLTVVDEKIDYLDEFIGQLMEELKSDGILQGMADWQLQEARMCIEKVLLQRLYRQVMFPNDDGDVARDQVLREHIRKLSKRITPSHSNLRIAQEYLMEAPWPFAQQQISYISAYKTPKEKVECVVRCVTSIMNLLSMVSSREPSADDLTPVLIYVIIKANPPYLLSTIEYVNCFIGDKLEGETGYWWTQFCSAVTFIKTMDYCE